MRRVRLSVQPALALKARDGHGWALSAGDLQFTYDWERGEWVNLPIGFQVGKVTNLGGQAMRLSLNPQWNLRDIEGLNKFKVVFTIAILAPAK